MTATRGVHKRSPSFVVLGIDIDRLWPREQVGAEIEVTSFGHFVENGIPYCVSGVEVELQPEFAMLDEINCSFELVLLGTHKKDILLLIGLDHHIGPQLLKQPQHFHIAMQPSKVQR